MSKPYAVIDVAGRCHGYNDKDDAMHAAITWTHGEESPHYVYKLVADVVVETRTVVEVIEHEHH